MPQIVIKAVELHATELATKLLSKYGALRETMTLHIDVDQGSMEQAELSAMNDSDPDAGNIRSVRFSGPRMVS